MPVSKKQLQANRQNAQKSTGPKTAEGKMISSRNAVRHGFRSHDMIINSPALKESKEEYDQLLASVFEELRPQSFFQAYLARRIAICL